MLTIASFVDGVVLTAAQLNTAFNAIKTYLDTTKLSTTSLQYPRSNVSLGYPVLGTTAAGGAKTFRWKVPAGVTWQPTEFQLYFNSVASGTPTVSLAVTCNGVSVLASALTQGTAATVATVASFNVTSFLAGEVVIVQLSVAGGNVDDIYAVLHGKTLHRS